METITICDLAVLCHIGVPEEERAKPQRLLISATIEGDFAQACLSDNLSQTVDYFQVCQRITRFCRENSFKLIERLGHEIASMILRDTAARRATVEVKKFIIPETRFISCTIRREKALG